MNSSFLAFVAACAVLVGGCSSAEKTAPVKSSATPEVERKTVEFVQRTETDLREHMTQWVREGWLVHSFIKVPQADGTVVWRAELSRPKSSPAPPQ